MTEQKGLIFRFAEFEVREQEFFLIRGSETIPVEPKAFRVLLYLLRNPHRLVTKNELLDAVWQETSVSENSLTRAVAVLRRLLGDDTREPRYIATVPTVGYRFVAVVSSPEESTAAPVTQPDPSPPVKKPPARPLGVQWVLAGSALTVLIVLILLVLIRRQSHGSPAGASAGEAAQAHSSELMSMRGAATVPVLSPDGKEIAFLWNGGNPSSDIYVQLIRDDRADQQPLRLTRNPSGFLCCASWSPDGRELAYGHCGDDGGAVFTISALGGSARRVADVRCLYGLGGSPAWSPDGTSLFIMDQCAPGAAPTLMHLSLTTGDKRCLVPSPADAMGDFDAILSPDQKTVAFIRLMSAGISDIYTLDLHTERLHRVTDERKAIWAFMWTPDSQHLVFRSSRGGLAGIWRVAAGGGSIEREILYPEVGSLSADGKRLVYLSNPGATSFSTTPGTPTTIMRADLSGAGGHVTALPDVVPLGAGLIDSPQLSPDETQLVFAFNPTGSGGWGGEIWKSKVDGSDAMQMTPADMHAGTPRWSSDGKLIVFDCRPGTRSQIYVMDSDSRNQKRLIWDGADDVTPSWSRDGRFVYYSSNRTGGYEIWKHEVATGTETQITHHGGLGALESYDGSTLYYSQLDGAGLWRVATAGGTEERLIDPPHSGYWGYFAVTDRGIYVLDTEYKPKPTILFYDPTNRKLTPVLPMPKSAIAQEPGMAASKDGKILLFAQEDQTSSITLVEYP